MFDSDLDKIVGKLQKLQAVRRARARVWRAERELYGQSTGPEEPAYVPEFLRQRFPVRVIGEIGSPATEQRTSSSVGPSRIGRAA